MNKNELQQYQWLQKNIKKLEDKLLELETAATKITPTLSDMPKSMQGDFDKMTDLIADIIKFKNKINQELNTAYRLAYKIEIAIATLPEREKYLMRAKYLEGKTWEQIAVEMNYSWRQVHNIHSDALKTLHKSAQ